MNNNNEAIKLLIHSSSQNDAEAIIALIRSHGHTVKPHIVTTLEDLANRLNEQSWHLFICEYQTKAMHCKDAIKYLNRTGRDIPTLILHEEPNSMIAEQVLKLGAADVVPTGENNHLLLVIERELKNIQTKRSLREAMVDVREIEKRNQALLDNAQDAIAYVHEGMHIFVNEAYVELLDYKDPDDLAGMPLIDLVAPKDQDKIKSFLKQYNEQSAKTEKVECTVQTENDKQFPVSLLLSQTEYDDEPCTQIIIRRKQGTASPDLDKKMELLSTRDALTKTLNKASIIDLIGTHINSAVMQGGSGACMYLSIDGFAKIQADVGLDGCDILLPLVAKQLNTFAPTGLGRIGESTFVLIWQTLTPEESLQKAEDICSAISKEMFEVKQKTVRFTCSVGVAIINEHSPSANEVLDRAFQACRYVLTLEGHEQGNGCYLYSTATMAASNEERLNAKVAEAIEKNQFKLRYQPCMAVDDPGGFYYETSIALMDGEKELVASEFLTNDVKPELQLKVDRWLISNAAKELATQREKHGDVRLIFNLSIHSLKDLELVKQVGGLAKKLKLPGEAIVFQFTERDVLAHLKQAQNFAKALNVLGFKFAIDNFGNADDPMDLIQHVKVDWISVSSKLSDSIESQPNALTALTELIGNLKDRNIITKVCNLSSPQVLAQLWSTGVNFVQGAYIQEPETEMNYEFDSEE